jgi:3-methylfumaryl-CoA hydratase
MLESSAPVTRMESCSAATVRRVAAMLDLDPDTFAEGAPLPRGWQFILLGADTRRSSLRGDGFPGLGVPMPDLGLPRLLLGGRTVSYRHEIAIGAPVRRTSAIKSLTQKTKDSGPMAVVVIAHELHTQAHATPAIVESQTYLLLPERSGPHEESDQAPPLPVSSERIETLVPDETLLFQYSALGFNSHKIHLDAAYAREVEGFPGLVVNGGLATLLLTEYLRNECRTVPTALKVRHLLPLFCDRPMTIAAQQDGATWHLQAFNDKGRLAVEMEVETE